MTVNSPQVNNTPSIPNSRAMQEPAIPSTPTELLAPFQHFSNIQTAEDNVSMPHGQDMNITNTRSSLESLAIPYNDNQSANPNLWDNIFSSASLIEIKKFFSSNAQNIMCSLLRIETFIKQCFLGDKLAKDFSKLVEISITS